MFAVTLVQCAPPSRVTCTRPSLVPAQMTPFSIGDSAIAKTTPAYSTRQVVERQAAGVADASLVSFSVRSGLIAFQVWPPSVVACTYWLPT